MRAPLSPPPPPGRARAAQCGRGYAWFVASMMVGMMWIFLTFAAQPNKLFATLFIQVGGTLLFRDGSEL